MTALPPIHDAALPEAVGIFAASDTEWVPQKGSKLVLRFVDGRLLSIGLSRRDIGNIVRVRSSFAGPGGEMGEAASARDATVSCVLVVCPGGGNAFQLALEAYRYGDGALVAGGAGGRSEFELHVEEDDGTSDPVLSELFLFHLGDQRFVRVEKAPEITRRHGRCANIQAGPLLTTGDAHKVKTESLLLTARLSLHFGAANVIEVDASPPYFARRIGPGPPGRVPE